LQEEKKSTGWQALFPAAQWLPEYQLRWLRSDLLFRDSDRFSFDLQHARARRMAKQDGETAIARGSAARCGT
jgi:hypothetical protein